MNFRATVIRGRACGLVAVVMAVAVACGGGYGGSDYNGNNMTPVPTVPVASASKFAATALVADVAGAAAHVDANLVNAWGVAFNPNGFVWVANNGSNTSTLYDGNGVPQTLVVGIPAAASGAAHPTGIVFNSSQDFKVSQNGVTGASAFIFVSEAGTVSGWSPAVNRTSSIDQLISECGDSGKSDACLRQRSKAAAVCTEARHFVSTRHGTHRCAPTKEAV